MKVPGEDDIIDPTGLSPEEIERRESLLAAAKIDEADEARKAYDEWDRRTSVGWDD